MCMRFEYAPLESHLSPVEEQFGRTVREELSEFPVNLNVRPTQRTPIIRWLTKERPSVVSARWGFVPKTAPANPFDLTFQTDVELAQTDVRWRYAWRYARCLIPATAWYENEAAMQVPLDEVLADRSTSTLIPPSLKVSEPNGQIMMLAGLHGFLTTEHGHRETVSVVTHLAQQRGERVKQNIPCVVGPTAWNQWLSPIATDPYRVTDYLEQPESPLRVSMIK